MSDNEQRYYNSHRLNIVFTLSSLVFLATILAMFWKDYNREWRHYQSAFRQIEIAKAEADLAAESERLEQVEAYKDLKGKVETLAGAQVTIQSELDELDAQQASTQKQLSVAMQEMNFKNADVSALKYKLEQAREHHGKGEAELEKAYAEDVKKATEKLHAVEALETQIADTEAAIKARTAMLTDATRELGKVTMRRDLLVRKLDGLDPERMSTATRIGDTVRDMPILDMLNPRYNIRDHQIIVQGITEDLIFTRVPRVDRCTVCHLAIDKPGFENEDQPFRTHPKLDVFLAASSPHPVKEFGCTSCHAGRGRGTSFVSATHMPEDAAHRAAWEEEHDWEKLHHWDRPMYPGKYTEAGCYQCHSGSPQVPGADTLNLGLSIIERAGCYGCHEIEPFKDKPKAGPTLQRVASKTNPDWTTRWLTDPKAFREHTWMPAFFGQSNNADIKDRTDQEVGSIVHYLFEESGDFPVAENVPEGDAENGAKLVRGLGCQGCHMLDGEAYPEALTLQAMRRQHGPQLTGLGSKTTAGWLYSWLTDPTSYHPGTRMPNLRLGEDEAADITANLLSLRNETFDSRPVPGVDGNLLDAITRDFMAKNMTHDQTEAQLAAMSDADKQHYSGERLIRRYGCFGCHDIPGFENARPIGTPLTEEGSKNISKFDFGLQHDLEHVNYAWFEAKLKNPRIFDGGLVKDPNDLLRMPNYHFSDQSVEALVTTMLAFQEKDEGLTKIVPRTPENLFVEKGESLVRELNCRGCHVVNGEGGAVQPAVEYWLENVYEPPEEPADEMAGDTNAVADAEADEWDEWGDEEEDAVDMAALALTYGPPSLNGEGAKVQPEWLFGFLQEPVTIRPWIQMRMPTFGLNDTELNTLVRYFNYLDGEEFPFVSMAAVDVHGEAFAAGKEMFSPAIMNCARCHIAGGKTPEGMPVDNLAPDLAMAKARLKPNWILDWLENPQVLLPGTRMPEFWPQDGPSPTTLLDGDSLRQREAIRDYVFSLSEE